MQLVTQAVGAIAPHGVVGADGTLYACDVIIWGTGFKATEFVAPMQIFGLAAEGAEGGAGAASADGSAGPQEEEIVDAEIVDDPKPDLNK